MAVHLKKGKTEEGSVYWKISRVAGIIILLVITGIAGAVVWKYNGSDSNRLIIEKNDKQSKTRTDISNVSASKQPPPPVNAVKQLSRISEVKAPDRKSMSLIENKPAQTPIVQTASKQKLNPNADYIPVPNDDSKSFGDKNEDSLNASVSEFEPNERNDEKYETAVIAHPEVNPEKEENNMDVLEDSGLKLMAIAWSDDPKSRIAVINDRIVREGDTVEGMTIYRINEEAVVLRKGSDTWKLLFRLK